jgi:transcriptional regulator with XRE-family HTH domain
MLIDHKAIFCYRKDSSMLPQLIPVDNHRQGLEFFMRRKVKIDPVKLGEMVADKRTLKRIRQADLGRAIFKGERLTDAAAQSRISRLECGKIKVDDFILDRIASVFKISVAEIQRECIIGAAHSPPLHYNLTLSPKLLEHFPALDAYIAIINTEIEDDNLRSALIAFGQLCEALRRRLGDGNEGNDCQNPTDGSDPK